MNTEFDHLIKGYAELNACYVERDIQLQALNRAINVAAHTPIFSFDLTLLVEVVQTIQQLESDFPDTKAFLKNPSVAIREMTIDFDLALPGHSQLKIGYNQIESLIDNLSYEKIKLWDLHVGHDAKTLNQSIDLAEAECAFLNALLSELKKEFPLAAMAFNETTELGEFDQHFDLILSGYSELKAAYATRTFLIGQYNAARKAVITHPAFNSNLQKLRELDQEILRLETRYPKALTYHQKLMADERMQVLDPEPEPPMYFPLDADYLFSNEGISMTKKSIFHKFMRPHSLFSEAVIQLNEDTPVSHWVTFGASRDGMSGVRSQAAQDELQIVTEGKSDD